MLFLSIPSSTPPTDPGLTQVIIVAVIFGFLLLVGYLFVGLIISYLVVFTSLSTAGILLILLGLAGLAFFTTLFVKLLRKIKKYKRGLKAKKQESQAPDTPTN